VINDLSAQRRKIDALERFEFVHNYFDPIWSPDSNFVVTTFWNGFPKYLLRPISDANFKTGQTDLGDHTNSLVLSLSKSYPADRPKWSPDSRYLTVASLKSVGIFDTTNGEWSEINLPGVNGENGVPNYQIFTSFDLPSNSLLIARDLNVFSNYEILSINLKTKQVKILGKNLTEPNWEMPFDGYSYVTNTRSTSPNGMLESVINFTYNNGLQENSLQIKGYLDTGYFDITSTAKNEPTNKKVFDDPHSSEKLETVMFTGLVVLLTFVLLIPYLGKNLNKAIKKTKRVENN
jgi:hypothetical protein